MVLPQGALGEGSPALCEDQVGEDRAEEEIWKENFLENEPERSKH